MSVMDINSIGRFTVRQRESPSLFYTAAQVEVCSDGFCGSLI
jgi:hypothetical protein